MMTFETPRGVDHQTGGFKDIFKVVISQLFKQRHCNTKGFSLQSPIKRSLAKRSLAKHIHNCEYFRGGYKENVRKIIFE